MTKGALAMGFLALIGLPLAARADLLTGVLNIAGTVNVSSNSITFVDNAFSVENPPSAQQGGFIALAGTAGALEALTEPPDDPGLLNVPYFMTFAAAPNISVTLTFLDPGTDGAAGCALTPPAAGQVCTPSGSLLNVLNMQDTSSSSSEITFGIEGVEVDNLTGDTTPITGQFNLPFAHQSFQDLLVTLVSAGRITTDFTAQISTPPVSDAPEPSTSIALLAAMAMIVGISRGHRARFEKDGPSRSS
jgi:hypothetical protein